MKSDIGLYFRTISHYICSRSGFFAIWAGVALAAIFLLAFIFSSHPVLVFIMAYVLCLYFPEAVGMDLYKGRAFYRLASAVGSLLLGGFFLIGALAGVEGVFFLAFVFFICGSILL